ncbi:hypothetical protein P7C70_g1277, partial [Phenoliferia sp. Uapishka_3]
MADDDNPSFESPDAAVKHYQKLCASLQTQLADANSDIQEFTESSKELQEELEKELAAMEASERNMRKGLDEARGEMEDWKAKYTTTLKEHAATMTHMQKELESLRASEKALRTKLRDMELDNDDLEKSEREKDSSLQDFETRYGKSLERTALLEEELVNKAHLEEEAQRLRDELRDLTEEMSVMKSQALSYPPAYPRPLTPPGPTPKARPLSATPSPPGSPSPTTPRARLAGPPSISLVGATPMPRRTVSPTKSPRIPPVPGVPPILRSFVTPLSRSTKTVNLSYAAAPTPPFKGISATPKAVRERRADGMIKDMKEMTDRVKQLTQKLDSRRNLVMAGSSIPRASPQRLGMSTRTISEGRTSSDLGESTTTHSTRPLSRSTLRMSMGQGPANRTGIPTRPPSRLSVSTTSSRSSTPTPRRSPTPSNGSSTTSTRPSWGANNYPTTATTTANALGASVRRRTSSTHAMPPPPLARKSTDLSATITAGAGRRSTEMLKAEQAALGLSVNGGHPRDGIARRASIALGRSVLRRPSTSNGS